MKRNLFSIACMLILHTVDAQSAFEKLFGDTTEECFAISIVQLQTGTLCIATNNLDTNGNNTVKIYFFDPNGIPVTEAVLNLPGTATVNKMKMIPDGNLLLAGTITDTTGQSDGLLIKTDTSGNIVWHQSFGSSVHNELLQGIDFSGDTIFSSGYADNNSGSGNAFYLICADSGGNLLWQHTYGSAFNSYSDAVVAFSNGKCILSGDRLLSTGNYTNAIISTDSTGNVFWDVEVPNPNNNGCKNDLLTMSGDILITGESSTPGNPSFEPFITRIDTAGNIRWSYIYNGSPVTTDALMDGVEPVAEKFVLAGYGGNAANGTGDVLLMEIDSAGQESGRTYFGDSSGVDIAYAIIKGISGGYYLCGKSERNSVSRGYLIYTQWSAPAAIPEYSSSENRLYPNPAVNSVYLPLKENSLVIVYDLSGYKVLSRYIENRKLNIESLSPGIYIATTPLLNAKKQWRFVKPY